MSDVLDMLDRLGIETETFAHPPVLTVEAAREHWATIDAAHTKNLVLKDAAGRCFLVVLPAEQPLDLKSLPDKIGSKRLRFAPADQLPDLLGVEAGAVSALAIVNDHDRRVELVIESSLMAADRIACHPLDNCRTTVLSPDGLQAFLRSIDREARIASL